MKKFLLLIILTLIFAACGGNGNEETEAVISSGEAGVNLPASPEPSPEIPTQEPEPTQEPTPTPEPSPPPAPLDGRIVYQSGILGVWFSIDASIDWGFDSETSIRNLNITTPNAPIFIYTNIYYEEYEFPIVFEIGEGTRHPRHWRGSFLDWHFFEGGRPFWEHPDEPTEVFENENGLTVVKYEITNEFLRMGTDYTTVLYIFREDGQDYRDFPEAQIFYYAMLDVPTAILEDYSDNVRATVESFQFHEGAAVGARPSEIADSLGITQTNFPRMDGSASTAPLIYRIIRNMYETQNSRRYSGPLGASHTVPSYELLINGLVDLILVPEPSEYVIQYAAESRVELEFIPIAVEALVFITHGDNSLHGLTREQVLEIYTGGTVNNWAQLGGDDIPLHPFNGDIYTDSQTFMNNLILRGSVIHPDLSRYFIRETDDLLYRVSRNFDWLDPGDERVGLGYTVFFFPERMFEYLDIRLLAFDGVIPTPETIRSGEYPLTANYFAVIRADTPDGHPARAIAEWLTTDEGQEIVRQAHLGSLR